MKRSELIQKLVNEGMSSKTLANFSDAQINNLAQRMLGEQATPGSVVMKKGTNPTDIKKMTDLGMNVALNEKLKGKQKNIDKNHNGKIDAEDFKMLKGQKKEVKEDLKDGQKKLDKNHNGKIDGQDFKILQGQKKKKEDMKEADMGLTVKAPKSSGSVFGAPAKKTSPMAPKKKSTPKKKVENDSEEGEVDETLNGLMLGVIKDKLSKDLGREPEDHEIDKAHEDFVNSWKKDNESKEKKKKGFVVGKQPSPNFNGHKKDDMDEMLRFYDDDGNPIKNKKGEQDAVSTKHKDFEKKTKNKKCPDCGEYEKDCECDHKHMDEQKEVNNWVNNLAESNFYHNFTSKGEIMELISTKLTEQDVAVAHGPNVKKGHNNVPEFMSYESIKSAGPATAPTKPTVKPGTKPGERPKTPTSPGKKPNPKPKASFE